VPDSNDDEMYVARVASLTKAYGTGASELTALRDVSIGIERARFTAVMGPSGSGKSTLMHIMAGLDSPTSGQVWLGGTDISRMNDAELTLLRRRRMGFIFQSFNLVPTLDVRDNIFLPFELDARRPTDQERRRVNELIDSLGLADRLSHRPHQLSGGQQQRVAIARAFATEPELIFADEPTGNLDSRTGRDVLSILSAATSDSGRSVAMVTHDPIAASYADRILFLVDGQVVDEFQRSSPEEISRRMLTLDRVS
jgi:putative ABC transport system ATP-binding protein